MPSAPAPAPAPAPASDPDTLLAFDTSTERMAVAVQTAQGRWSEDQEGGAAASMTLLPALQSLLARAQRGMKDVAAVAFGCGPGAFTGLRTSCAVAQGLAFGLARPVLPIDSLLIVAEQLRQQWQAADDAELDIGVAMDARMGEIYAARYRWLQGQWQVRQAPRLWAPEDLARVWQPDAPALCTGTALALHAGVLQTAGAGSRWIDAGEQRAAALMTLAAQAFIAGAGLDAAQALPLYLRDKVALTTAERQAAQASDRTPVPPPAISPPAISPPANSPPAIPPTQSPQSGASAA